MDLADARLRSSSAASNPLVPPPNMMRVLASAIRSGAPSEIKNALSEIDLVGRKRDDVIEEVVLGAVHYEDYAFLDTLLNTQDPHSDGPSTSARRLVDVNKLPEQVIVYAMAKTKTVEAVEMFLDAGLNVQKPFKTGENIDVDAVGWALKLKSPRLMSQVLEKGVLYPYLFILAIDIGICKRFVDIEDAIEKTGRLKEICLSLMTYGADLAVSESLEVAQAELHHGADVNELVSRGALPYDAEQRPPIDTPLVEAVMGRFPEMLELLLDNGADPSIIGHSGMTTMGMAVYYGGKEMVDLLKAKGVSHECGILPTQEDWWKPLE